MCRFIPIPLVAALCLCTPPAVAGQLHIRWFGLSEVAQHGGYAVKGTVSKVEVTRGWIEVLVRRTWRRDPAKAPGLKPGTTFRARLYPGVKWTDPRESPIDQRLIGSVRIGGLKPGQELLLAPLGGGKPTRTQFEVVPWTRRSAVRLDVHFTARGVQTYRKSSVADLRRDLADWDLFSVAYQELSRRKALTAKALLSAAGSRLAVDPVSYHLKHIPEKRMGRFMAAAASAVKGDPRAQARLFRQVESHLKPETAHAFGLLYASAEPDTPAARTAAWTLAYWARKHRQPQHLAPFAAFVGRYAGQRPGDEKARELATLLCDTITGKPLLALGRALLVAAPGTQKSGAVRTDPFLFQTAARCAVRGPSKTYVKPLLRITPETVRILSVREDVIAALLDMAIAIGHRHPRSVTALAGVVEPWLALPRLEIEGGRLKRWRALHPAGRR